MLRKTVSSLLLISSSLAFGWGSGSWAPPGGYMAPPAMWNYAPPVRMAPPTFDGPPIVYGPLGPAVPFTPNVGPVYPPFTPPWGVPPWVGKHPADDPGGPGPEPTPPPGPNCYHDCQ